MKRVSRLRCARLYPNFLAIFLANYLCLRLPWEQLEAVSTRVTFKEGVSVAHFFLSTWATLSGCGAAAIPSPLEVRHYTECALTYIWQHKQQELGAKLVNRCILLWTATACCWCVHSIGLPCFPNTACPIARYSLNCSWCVGTLSGVVRSNCYKQRYCFTNKENVSCCFSPSSLKFFKFWNLAFYSLYNK